MRIWHLEEACLPTWKLPPADGSWGGGPATWVTMVLHGDLDDLDHNYIDLDDVDNNCNDGNFFFARSTCF